MKIAALESVRGLEINENETERFSYWYLVIGMWHFALHLTESWWLSKMHILIQSIFVSFVFDCNMTVGIPKISKGKKTSITSCAKHTYLFKLIIKVSFSKSSCKKTSNNSFNKVKIYLYSFVCFCQMLDKRKIRKVPTYLLSLNRNLSR